MGTEHKGMHIDRANEIAVAGKAAGVACPGSASGFVTMPTSGTPARCSSFGAGEARDASLFGFVREVVNILAVLPAGHALVVMASSVPAAHAVRIADEQGSDLVFNTEVNHGPGRFMAHIPNAPLGTLTYLALRALQLLPTARVLLAPALFFGEVPQLFAALPFERADAAPGHDQGFPGIGADSGKVYLAQINRRLYRAGSLCRLFRLDADVQLEAVVPHEGTGPSIVRERNRQHDGRSPSPHRQDDTALLQGHRLRGPVDWVEALLTPGVLHAHLRVLPAEFAGGFNVGEKGVHDHLHRLAVQGIPPFGRLLQLVAPRPAGVAHPGLFVQGDAQVPDLCRFHLHLSEVLEEGWREMIEPIDMYGFHRQVFFLCARTMVTYRARRRKMSGVAFIPSAFPGRDFPLLC